MNSNSQESCTESSCQTYRRAIEFIGKRWTGIIVYQLLAGPKRYHELLHAIDGISDRLLSERLKDLETENLVVKYIITETPKKVEYELTPLGYEFNKVFRAIMDWAVKKESYDKEEK
ncbi:helix-turn-helix domain-containing protein [Sporosarcina sp. GW1-11]|uniref:winged helix-turn-helix transcriptional regulator n=1 Tax=Sporosarcina sp. GW1-11 TaxID=2899126 RepID=UPI00294DAB62|nr:helix-turn-helix domain-containing protein [Sporosarcina sp. GW1-11]MDV6378599.1 helix-turn-helix domain-containing protein [Sporosarcina sp. GW1-11]